MLNQLRTMFEEKRTLQLRDIVTWKKDGRWSERLMLYLKENGKIGLINIETAVSSPLEFDTLQQTTHHFRIVEVDQNVINVTAREDWVVYVP